MTNAETIARLHLELAQEREQREALARAMPAASGPGWVDYDPKYVERTFLRDAPFAEQVSDFMSPELREAVTAWRTEREAAVAAYQRWTQLTGPDAARAAERADADAYNAAIERGNYGDPTTAARDKLAAGIRATEREVEVRGQRTYEARNRMLETADKQPLPPTDARIMTEVGKLLDKMRPLVGQLDGRHRVVVWGQEMIRAHGRGSGAPHPPVAGPGVDALERLRHVLDDLAALPVHIELPGVHESVEES
jgi:hypothetical protein